MNKTIVVTRASGQPFGISPEALLLLYVAAFAAFIVAAPVEPDLLKPLSNLLQIFAPAAAAILCWQVSRRGRDGRDVWSWRMLATSAAGWAFAQAMWLYYGVVLAIDAPPVSLADVVWLATYVPAVVGLMLQVPSKGRATAQATTLMDAFLFTLGAAGLCWQLLLRSILAKISDPLVGVVNVAYPLADLLLCFAIISLILRAPLEQVPTHLFWLLAAFAAEIVADLGYASMISSNTYQVGNLIDAIWPLGYAFVGIAALLRRRAVAANDLDGSRGLVNLTRTGTIRMVLPYLAVPAVGLLVYLQYAESGTSLEGDAFWVTTFAALVVVLVMARQFVTLYENSKLGKDLAALSQELEARVEKRTAELATRTTQLETRTEQLSVRSRQLDALHDAATELGKCLSSAEVVSTGVTLACEAVRSDAGLVWLLGPDGQAQLAAHRGLPEDLVTLHQRLPNEVPAVADAVRAGRALILRPSESTADQPTSFPAGPRAGTVLVAPLVSRQEVLGSIALIGMATDSAFGEAELQLASAIGADMGLALENVRRYEEARELADRDSVTGLLNHRAFHQRLQAEVKRADRSDARLCLAMMDLDGFKLFNDTFGHPVGDQVLRDVGKVLTDCSREHDTLARYGGDEFAALLSETDADGGLLWAQRVRQALARHPYFAADSSKVPIRMSFGVAGFPVDARQSHELVVVADANLYESKQLGGDTITGGQVAPRETIQRTSSFGVLEGLVTAVDNKDRYTRKHSEDVMNHSLALAQRLGLSEESQRTLRIAGLLHDVGKIGVPDRILRKPAKLDNDEFAIVKQHALLGEMIIKEVPNVTDVLSAVGSHHERFDGRGYPRGLKNGEIPMLGRILAVADAYSAMTTDRPYRKGLSAAEAREELLKAAGSQLDPDLVGVFVDEYLPSVLAERDGQEVEEQRLVVAV